MAQLLLGGWPPSYLLSHQVNFEGSPSRTVGDMDYKINWTKIPELNIWRSFCWNCICCFMFVWCFVSLFLDLVSCTLVPRSFFSFLTECFQSKTSTPHCFQVPPCIPATRKSGKNDKARLHLAKMANLFGLPERAETLQPFWSIWETPLTWTFGSKIREAVNLFLEVLLFGQGKNWQTKSSWTTCII